MSRTKGILTYKEFAELYDECLKNWPKPTAKMSKIEQQLGYLFDEFIEICTQRAFRYAYQLGYEAAIKDTISMKEKGGVEA